MSKIIGGKGISVTETEYGTVIADYAPNATRHLIASMVKSFIRILGYSVLFLVGARWANIAAIILIVSELIGIVEELV